MKRLFAVLALFALVAPVHAHFIWLVPTKDSSVQMVFSDSLEPDANVPITKIQQTEVFARVGGKDIEVKKTEAKDHYLLKVGGFQAVEIGAVCRYGVLAKKGDPYLLMYYAKTTLGPRGKDGKSWAKMPLEIVEPAPGNFAVLWQGKQISEVEMTAMVPGADDTRTLKQNKDGTFDLGAIPAVTGTIGLRAKFVEKKEGELAGSKYKEARHYSTWTFAVTAAKAKASSVSYIEQPTKADAAATKLLADARAGRAVWNNFPGFSADLLVNINGKTSKGKVEVASSGKLTLKIDAEDSVKDWARRTIASLVMHRMPGTDENTPCAFIDAVEQHPSGRAIRVLNDELHSSYRIRDGQIIEVNRSMKDTRFTITVLENTWTKEKQYLPASYVVNTWDLKTNALVNSVAHHNTWTRIGAFDLPVSVRSVNAKASELDNRLITFSNVQLVK